MKLYVIDEGQLQMLKHIAARLFTEERINGDDNANVCTSALWYGEDLFGYSNF